MAESNAQHYRGVGLALAAGVLWSLGGLLIKWVEWNPLAISGARSAIAAVILLVVLRQPRITWSLAQVGGAMAYAATVILFVAATKRITVAAYATAPPTCASDQVKRGRRTTASIKRAAIALRAPDIASGFHSTHLMSRPPRLHKIPAASASPTPR